MSLHIRFVSFISKIPCVVLQAQQLNKCPTNKKNNVLMNRVNNQIFFGFDESTTTFFGMKKLYKFNLLTTLKWRGGGVLNHFQFCLSWFAWIINYMRVSSLISTVSVSF